MPLQTCKPGNKISAKGLPLAQESSFQLLEGDNTTRDKALRRPQGPLLHACVCDEDVRVCLGEGKEEKKKYL